MVRFHAGPFVISKQYEIVCGSKNLPGFRWKVQVQAISEDEARTKAANRPRCLDEDPYCLVVQVGDELVKFRSWPTQAEAYADLGNIVTGKWALLRNDSKVSGMVLEVSAPPITAGRLNPAVN